MAQRDDQFALNAGNRVYNSLSDIDKNALGFVTERCNSVWQKWNNGRPCVFAEAARRWIDKPWSVLVAISRILLSRQSANFEGFSVRPVPVTIVPGARPVISAPERRKTHRRKIRDGWDAISATIVSPSNRVFFCHRRLLLVDIVFIIGLKPSARLRARLSARLEASSSKSDFIRALALAFFRLANVFRSYAESLLSREVKRRTCA